MNGYWTFALVLALVLLQTTVAPRLTMLGVHPELPLIAVTAWSLLRGSGEGTLWALIAGVAMDLISGAPFGMSTLPLVVIGFGVGLSQRDVLRSDLGARHLLIPILVIPVATLVYQSAMLAWLKAFGWPVTWGEGLGRVILPSIIVNTLIMPVVYWLLRLLSRHAELRAGRMTW
jgi:rod shape-determining protein MreD